MFVVRLTLRTLVIVAGYGLGYGVLCALLVGLGADPAGLTFAECFLFGSVIGLVVALWSAFIDITRAKTEKL